MATVTALYPAGPAFDLAYYVDKHVPLVESKWSPLGLLSVEVVSFSAGQAYQIQTIMKWKSLASFDAAAADPVAAELFGDVKNFTTAESILLKGNVERSS
ncbi:MAG: hypothetical protein M1821_007987 [Bathelium mastoideum]|nr:MAG: hypothetical protein M1821_007987 [Bathelium mastoideum]KAI9693033.1 MAG: hypothetical protein M1822_005028 [Bathelium mastoideum]